MNTYVHLVLETQIKLWRLTSRDRLRRAFKRIGEATLVADTDEVSGEGSVLVIRGDYLYDMRVLKELVAAQNIALWAPDGETIVAVHSSGEFAQGVRDLVLGNATIDSFPLLRSMTPETLCSGFCEKLRKFETPFVLPIKAENRRVLQQKLFDGAYKGVTDLVTKWIWPLPARWVTAVCARFGIRPNFVTSLSWVLAVAAGLLFAQGQFALGLAAGWLMTFLDTVDGKLARVTVSYTSFGDRFDHILDLVHPPFWYLAWGVGLAAEGFGAFGMTILLIFVGYVFGRLVEGAFSFWLGSFSIFSWRPIDSYSRLITARRNPSLILLTVGLMCGRPDAGLMAVAMWTLLSTLFLMFRLVMAWYQRRASGPLQSWLMELDSKAVFPSLAARWFAA